MLRPEGEAYAALDVYKPDASGRIIRESGVVAALQPLAHAGKGLRVHADAVVAHRYVQARTRDLDCDVYAYSARFGLAAVYESVFHERLYGECRQPVVRCGAACINAVTQVVVAQLLQVQIALSYLQLVPEVYLSIGVDHPAQQRRQLVDA